MRWKPANSMFVIVEQHAKGMAWEHAHGVRMACGGCGGFQLHQCAVEIHNRSEDSGPSKRTVVEHYSQTDGGGPDCPCAEVFDEIDANPSWRRQGLRIAFRCEHCDAITGLSVEQHKGHTFVNSSVLSEDDKETA